MLLVCVFVLEFSRVDVSVGSMSQAGRYSISAIEPDQDIGVCSLRDLLVVSADSAEKGVTAVRRSSSVING